MANYTQAEVIECLPKDSWFRKYMECWEFQEPPKSYILLAAMSMMGIALGRRIWFGQDFRKLWPMLNVLLIGPSGIGKSTAIEMAEPLLRTLPKIEQPQFIVGGATKEKLHADLLPNPNAIIFASELAAFFNKADYNQQLIPYVTELLDYKPVEGRTKTSGVIRIEEPSVAVIGGSTKEWLQEQLPDTAVSGGFLARFLIMPEEHKAQKIADPEGSVSEKKLREIQENRRAVFAEFPALVQNAGGQMKFKDYGASDAYSVWYSSHQPINGHLAPFAARAPEFIKRISMLLAVSANREFIQEEDVNCAIKLHSFTEKRLQQVVVPMTVQGKMLARVLETIGTGAVTDVEIKQGMRNFLDSQAVDKLIQSLLQSRDIKYIDGKFMRA